MSALAIILLIIFAGFLAGSESALSSISRVLIDDLSVKRGSKEEYEATLDDILTTISNVKAYIESEPISGRELNQY